MSNANKLQLIQVPEYLGNSLGAIISPLGTCSPTCESAAMCGQCAGQGCPGQCPGQCGACQTVLCDACQLTTQCSTCQSANQTPSVTPWSWTSSNGSASTALTANAHTAVTSGGYLSDFSYLVWNDLCDKVNATAIAAGDAWIVNWGSLSATKMSSSNKNMTAVRFNALKNNIGARESTGIQDVVAGQTIYGSYFTTLTTKLNAWISRI